MRTRAERAAVGAVVLAALVAGGVGYWHWQPPVPAARFVQPADGATLAVGRSVELQIATANIEEQLLCNGVTATLDARGMAHLQVAGPVRPGLWLVRCVLGLDGAASVHRTFKAVSEPAVGSADVALVIPRPAFSPDGSRLMDALGGAVRSTAAELVKAAVKQGEGRVYEADLPGGATLSVRIEQLAPGNLRLALTPQPPDRLEARVHFGGMRASVRTSLTLAPSAPRVGGGPDSPAGRSKLAATWDGLVAAVDGAVVSAKEAAFGAARGLVERALTTDAEAEGGLWWRRG